MTKTCLKELVKKRNIPEFNLCSLDEFSYKIENIEKLSKDKYKANLILDLEGQSQEISTYIRIKNEDGKRKIDYINLKDLQAVLEKLKVKK